MVATAVLQFSSIKLIIGVSLCCAYGSAAGPLDTVNSGPQSEPHLRKTLNSSTLTEEEAYAGPQQASVAVDISGREARMSDLGQMINNILARKSLDLVGIVGKKFHPWEPLPTMKREMRKYMMQLESIEQKEWLLLGVLHLCKSAHPSEQVAGDTALISLLGDRELVPLIHNQWIREKISPSTALEFLRRHVPDHNLQDFFKWSPASQWLSYVGRYWEHGESDYTEETLFQLFNEKNVRATTIAWVAGSAQKFPGGALVFNRILEHSLSEASTHPLAFSLLLDELPSREQFSRIWKQLGEDPLNFWLEYVANHYNSDARIPMTNAIRLVLEENGLTHNSQRKLFQHIHNLMKRKNQNPSLKGLDWQPRPLVLDTLNGRTLQLHPFADWGLPQEPRLRDRELTRLADGMLAHLGKED